MNIQFVMHHSYTNDFVNSCEAVIRNVGQGTLAATKQAVSEIMEESQRQVPVDTGALKASAWSEIRRRGDVKGYRYEGHMGYANRIGNAYSSITPSGRELSAGSTVFRHSGRLDVKSAQPDVARATTGMVNPKSGKAVSLYAARVHEDLRMPHANGTKAKFLEDPVRAYGASRFTRVAETYWKQSIEMMNLRVEFSGRKRNSSVMLNRRLPVLRYVNVDTGETKRGI